MRNRQPPKSKIVLNRGSAVFESDQNPAEPIVAQGDTSFALIRSNTLLKSPVSVIPGWPLKRVYALMAASGMTTERFFSSLLSEMVIPRH